MRRIKVFDTTLRDGEQSPGCSMNLSEKLDMARQLEALGVDVIEAGFAIVSPDDFKSVETVSKMVKNCTVASLARCAKGDVDAAWNALKHAKKPRIHLFIATSDIHMEYKLRMTREQVLQSIRESVSYARSLCQDIEFSTEDGSRSDRAFLAECCSVAVECGASTINVPDTVGYCTPEDLDSPFETHLLIRQKSKWINVGAIKHNQGPRRSFVRRKWEAACENYLPYLLCARDTLLGKKVERR